MHAYVHIYIIGTQMVLTMKLTSFAYNLHDGADENVFKSHENSQKDKVELFIYVYKLYSHAYRYI